MGFKKANKRALLNPTGKGGIKPKRSKQFWQQRPTINFQVEDKDSASGSDEEVEEEEITEYDALLKVYGAQTCDVRSDEESDVDEAEEEEICEGEMEEEENDMDEEDVSLNGVDGIDEEDLLSNEEENETIDLESGEDENETIDLESGEEENETIDLESGEEEEEIVDTDIGSDILDENEEEFPEMDDENDTCGPSDPFVFRYELELQPSIIQNLESSNPYKPIETLQFKVLGRAEQRLLNLDNVQLLEDHSKSKLLEEEPTEEDDTGNECKKIRSFQLDAIKKPPKNFSSLSQMNVMKRILNKNPEENWGPMEKEDDNNSGKLRSAYVLHAVNHILKSKAKIVSNNIKSKAGKEVRDQGLIRPKVLIVVPFRESARKIINSLKDCVFSTPAEISKNVANNPRFMEDFGGIDEELPEKRNKPDDFYNFDLIIASPLGLRLIIGVEGEKDRDFDFLNSIEMLIMDQMDVFSMQNWDHVLEIMSQLHKKPIKSHGVDFGRVRIWSLNGLNKFYRQTIFLSNIRMPEINALFNKECINYMGKIKINNPIKLGTICRVLGGINVPMTFRRFVSSELTRSPECRFNYFVSKILPDYTKDSMFHTLIFIPSYFDFVRLRNHFNVSSHDYGEICEYTKDKNIAAAHDSGLKECVIWVFYQLPQNPQFYPELVNHMLFQNRKGGGSDGHMSVTVLYDKYDVHRVSAVAGTDRCSKMFTSDKSTHMFMSDER
ncbi:UTP25 [Lepeophtheirus salmonis]|uniref:U3 small nucleolar RNA-associated protein 25 homolog n=1 Tax=Lepeophtheirus salmonis TaxID=72036 RepID=A0A7R8CS10_LEPSM|nr:UTP25 [Lepeophtheirus salmonis]CAF2875320.1 UTP25 [Lepeophtheirus salmonis]